MIEVKGKNGIYAKVLAHSRSPEGVELLTFEVAYPRIILAELNTHRMLSKNSASSRAIPFDKMKEALTGMPVRFGANQSGMQDKGEDFDGGIVLDGFTLYPETPHTCWELAKESALEYAEAFKTAGYHKQVYNRLTEPFQTMKSVISGTEWTNFIWLRDDDAADPTIRELARCMREAKEQSVPVDLKHGEWHLPYIHIDYFGFEEGVVEQHFYLDKDDNISDEIPLEQAIKVSCARACAVSYRNVDYDVEKSEQVYERLISDSKIHGSALEHAAKVMKQSTNATDCSGSCYGWGTYEWEDGVSHMDRNGQLWSGNFRGFIQHRKTIDGENKT